MAPNTIRGILLSTYIHIYIPFPRHKADTMDSLETCIEAWQRSLHGCTVHEILHCCMIQYMYSSIAMGIVVQTISCMTLAHAVLASLFSAAYDEENGVLDMHFVHSTWIVFIFLSQFFCIYIYPAYFHHFLCPSMHMYLYTYEYLIFNWLSNRFIFFNFIFSVRLTNTIRGQEATRVTNTKAQIRRQRKRAFLYLRPTF